MTERVTPATSPSESPSPTTTSESQSQSGFTAALVATSLVDIPEGDTAALCESVRTLTPSQRKALALHIGASVPALHWALPTILTSPSGPSPSETVREHLTALVDGLAAFVNGARERDRLASDVDVPAMLTAALARVAPNVAVVERVETRRSGKVHTPKVRDWSKAAGNYTVKKRGGGIGTVVVRVTNGTPSFHVNGQKVRSASDALRAAAGWKSGEKGNGSPFRELKDKDGKRLEERAPEVLKK